MEKVLMEDLKNYSFLSQLKYSPNSKNIAVIKKTANESNSYNSVIYLYNKDSSFTPLTKMDSKVSLFSWLDDESIMFSEMRDGNTKNLVEQGFEKTSFYKISILGGEAVHLFDIDLKVIDLIPLKSNKYLVNAIFDNNYPDLDNKTDFEKQAVLAEFKKEKDYQVVDELPFYFNGKGFVNKLRNRLYIFDGVNLEPITSPLYNVNLYTLSSCKNIITYTGNNHTDVLDQKNEISTYDINTNKTTLIVSNDYYISKIAYSSGNIVFAGSERKLYGTVEDPDFYIVDNNKNVELLSKFSYSLASLPGSDCRIGSGTTFKEYNNDIFFTSLNNYTTDIYKLNIENKTIEKFTDLKGSVDFFDISDSGLIISGFFNDKLQEIYSYDNGSISQISNFNKDALENKYYSKPIHHLFKDRDGYEIDGWAIYPIDYDENKKYPCILNIHGGPKTAYGDIYFHEMQYWASKGYFVIFSNPRGSDGKSNDFANIRGIYGTVDYDNLMMFTDEMINRYPAIDINKLGVTGGSYGGYMTNWIVGHTDRFKSAAAQRSISNWMTVTYTSDIGYYFDTDQARADAWNDPNQVWDMSPLKYAENVKTPLLLIHSDEDFRCGIWEAYQMFTAVKLRGVDSKIFIFHGENHELSRSGKPDHRIRRLKEITDWMDKYL